LFFFLIGIMPNAWGQEGSPQASTTSADTSAPGQVTIDNSDFSRFIRDGEGYVQRHYGDVRARQDSVFFSSDTAILQNNNFNAWYSVNIQQGDSLVIFSDSLLYEGDSLLAYLYNNVSLIDRDLTLFNDFILYDVGTKVASYNTPGLLTQGQARLISKRGTYYSETGEMYFYDSVRVEHPDFLLKTERLLFHTKSNRIEFLGPTLITFDEQRIYCESGFYEIDNQFAHLMDRPQLVSENDVTQADDIYHYGQDSITVLVGNVDYKGDKRSTKSDTLIYDQKKGRTIWRGNVLYEDGENQVRGPELVYMNETADIMAARRAEFQIGEGQFLMADSTFREDKSDRSIAVGGVIWRDTLEGITLYSPQLESQGEQVLTSGGRSVMVFSSTAGDSIFVAAEIIESQLDTQRYMVDSITSTVDSSRTLLAIRDVRIWSADFSGHCDSLVYQEKDSLFRLYTDPIIWSDSSQISGDSIFLHLADGQLDRMFALGNAFMLEQVLGPVFQQVKSKTMEARFVKGQIKDLWALANAEMYYYVQDDAGDFMGLQSSKSGQIQAVFDSTATIRDIKWFSEIEGEIIPIKEVDPLAYRLEGFDWKGEQKPQNIGALNADESLMPYIYGQIAPTEVQQIKGDPDESLNAQKKVIQWILHYLFIIPY